MANECLFCKIIKGQIPSKIVYEDDFIFAFEDINPLAKVHTLIIPKKHIESLHKLDKEDEVLIGYLLGKVKEIASLKGISEYRLISNCGKDAGQEVFHLHWHLLGGQKLGALLQK